MSLQVCGKNILECEITAITQNGIWILIINKEYFISFKDYPEFMNNKIKDIQEVKFYPPDHLYWEKLDIDIELRALEFPHEYPNKFIVGAYDDTSFEL